MDLGGIALIHESERMCSLVFGHTRSNAGLRLPRNKEHRGGQFLKDDSEKGEKAKTCNI